MLRPLSRFLKLSPTDVWLLDPLPYGRKLLSTMPEVGVGWMRSGAKVIVYEKLEFVLCKIKLQNV